MRTERTQGICDRCGLEFKLKSLKAQVVARKVTSLLVCRSCMDEDQPQWFSARIARGDPRPIPNIRPEIGEAAAMAGFGWGPVGGPGTTLVCGIQYDFDLYDATATQVSASSYIAQEDGFPVTQEDTDLISGEA